MNRDEVCAFCLDLPAAEETYPFGDEVAVFKVGGRMFALVSLGGEPVVNLKCDPSRALGIVGVTGTDGGRLVCWRSE